MMFDCLSRFGTESPQTRIEWLETVIGGTAEALQSGVADSGRRRACPAGTQRRAADGGELRPRRASGACAPQARSRDYDARSAQASALIVRDSSAQRDKKSELLEVEQRWTVTNMSTSIGAVSRGHGFAWLPQDKIRTELEDGTLKILPVRGGACAPCSCI
jgi:DNA-binding transcriptional LysR family regulator